MRRPAALALAAVAASVLVACAPAASPPAATETAAGNPSGASSSAPAENPAAAGPPTCDGILPASTVKAFAKVGWTSQQVPFYIGDLELTDGVECQWADFSKASDNMQIFGWAPITDAQAKTARDGLLAAGWHILKDTDNGTYVTEDKSTVVAPDSDGYGTTYLFGDGWVEVADTKQGLLLVEWPPA